MRSVKRGARAEANAQGVWRLALALLFACETSDFEAEVLPLVEARCASAACHGVAEGDEWPGVEGFFVRLDARGRIAEPSEARERLVERVSTEAPWQSSLVRVPLPSWAGGGPHAGGALFRGADDPELASIVRWIRSLRAAGETGGEDGALTREERRFGRAVLPDLMDRCARGGCHSADDLAFTAIPVRETVRENAAALDDGDARFSPAQIRAARRTMRKHLDLWSDDPWRSRIVRKTLGEADGGMVHRGDLSTFFPEAPPDDPRAAPALQRWMRWIEAEREVVEVDGAIEGVLFVAGPSHTRAPFRIEEGPLGSDVFVVGYPTPGEPRNLSAALHPEGPVEIRGLALSHDATRVVFAMRRASEARFSLYEVGIDGGDGRLFAQAEGSLVDPVFGPDGRVIAAWDGHAERAADGPGIAPELVAIDDAGRLERLTFTPAPEVAPAVLASGKTRGMVGFATRRAGPLGVEGVLFRFPLCHDDTHHGEPEYHVQFGASVAPRAPHVARDLPDGRQLLTLLDDADVRDDPGALAILDRALGPATRPGEVPSASGLRAPLVVLDAEARWRDPQPLPDGSALVTRREDDGDGALVRVTIEDAMGGPRARFEPWLRLRGRTIRAAIAIARRPLEDDAHPPVVEPAYDRGVLVLRDVAVLETLYARAAPHGARELRDEIRELRITEALVRAPGDDASFGLGGALPTRVLAELALPADRSAYLDVPARTPLRLAFLDARGMEVGEALDRWYFAEGAESVPGGTNLATYASACAGCHGAASGRASDASAPAPDAISSASLTLSTYRDRDRRRPLDPVVIGEGERSDFRALVEPSLAACVGCHDATSSVPLVGDGERFPRAYEVLFARVDADAFRARRSPLIELLLGEELEAPGAPRAHPTVDAPTLRRFVRWIEAGAFHALPEATR